MAFQNVAFVFDLAVYVRGGKRPASPCVGKGIGFLKDW